MFRVIMKTDYWFNKGEWGKRENNTGDEPKQGTIDDR
jgi:hypothetical protein